MAAKNIYKNSKKYKNILNNFSSVDETSFVAQANLDVWKMMAMITSNIIIIFMMKRMAKLMMMIEQVE